MSKLNRVLLVFGENFAWLVMAFPFLLGLIVVLILMILAGQRTAPVAPIEHAPTEQENGRNGNHPIPPGSSHIDRDSARRQTAVALARDSATASPPAVWPRPRWSTACRR